MDVGDRRRFESLRIQAISIVRVVVPIAGVIPSILLVMIVSHIPTSVRMTPAWRHDAAQQQYCTKQQAGGCSQAGSSHNVNLSNAPMEMLP